MGSAALGGLACPFVCSENWDLPLTCGMASSEQACGSDTGWLCAWPPSLYLPSVPSEHALCVPGPAGAARLSLRCREGLTCLLVCLTLCSMVL